MFKVVRTLLTVTWFGFLAKLAGEGKGSSLDFVMVGVMLLMSVALGLVWAPVVGEWVARPLTNVLTGTDYDECLDSFSVRLIRHFEQEGDRRGIIAACLFMAFMHPEGTTAYVIGMEHSLPNTRTERWFATMLYERGKGVLAFNAYRVLIRHKINPTQHTDPKVNEMVFQFNLARESATHSSPMRLNPSAVAEALDSNSEMEVATLRETGSTKDISGVQTQ